MIEKLRRKIELSGFEIINIENENLFVNKEAIINVTMSFIKGYFIIKYDEGLKIYFNIEEINESLDSRNIEELKRILDIAKKIIKGE